MLDRHTINGPYGFCYEIWSLRGQLKSDIQFALTSSSTIRNCSGVNLQEKDIPEITSEQLKLQNVINQLNDLLGLLSQWQTQLEEEKSLLEQACLYGLRPFPVSLPLDIARHIIRIAAASDEKTARNLTLVSKQVYTWSEPLLWRTILVRNYASAENLHSLLLQDTFRSKRAQHIHRFIISETVNPDHPIFYDCFSLLPNIEAFTYWRRPSASLPDNHTLLPCPSLRRLSCDPHLFNIDGIHLSDFDSPLFWNLTHLDLLHGKSHHSFVWASLASLTNLTHFMLNCDYLIPVYEGIDSQDEILSINGCRGLLKSLPPSVQLVILDFEEELPWSGNYNQLRLGLADPRVIVGLFNQPPSLEWVLSVSRRSTLQFELGEGEEDSVPPPRLYSFWSIRGIRQATVWEEGMDLLRRRALAFGIRPES
ncbi:hypothetical protein DL96DRAFT_1585835 [Flagelloscypha sp. PMI_526]|nr:hypothetical protein DL96DRAFT_1585835 [Flagelloscypha sp. PMI_526]